MGGGAGFLGATHRARRRDLGIKEGDPQGQEKLGISELHNVYTSSSECLLIFSFPYSKTFACYGFFKKLLSLFVM